MEDIYLDKLLNKDQILITLSEVFSELTVFHYNFNDDIPEKLDLNNPNHIFFNTEEEFDAKEFSFKISIYRTPEVHHQERELYLGKIFSEKYKIKILIPFVKPDEPNDPYYCIVFENGKIFLADDSEIDNSNNTGMIKILQEYNLPVIGFDKKAIFIHN
jgi:hypothetical protein